MDVLALYLSMLCSKELSGDLIGRVDRCGTRGNVGSNRSGIIGGARHECETE